MYRYSIMVDMRSWGVQFRTSSEFEPLMYTVPHTTYLGTCIRTSYSAETDVIRPTVRTRYCKLVRTRNVSLVRTVHYIGTSTRAWYSYSYS